jgi:hypothetical protein
MVWWTRRARGALASGALVAGSLVKATGLAAAPALAIWLWRRGGWTRLGSALLAGLLVAGLGYAPFWAGPATLLPFWQQTRQPGWSLASLLLAASAWLPGGPCELAVRAGLGLVWALAYGWIVAHASRRAPLAGPQAARQVAATAAWLLLVTLALLTSAVFAHYLVPVVALTAVAGSARLERLVGWLSLGGLAFYALDLLGLALWPGWLGSVGYRVLGSLVLLGSTGLALWPPPGGQAQPNAGHQDEAADLDQRRVAQATGQ